jgi:uncharacterized protein
MITKDILFCESNSTVACDGNCAKAWGINGRPREYFQDSYADPDDYVFISDDVLGKAPEPGRTVTPSVRADEKPHALMLVDGARMNRWCAQECERSVVVQRGHLPVLPDMRSPQPNKPIRRKEVVIPQNKALVGASRRIRLYPSGTLFRPFDPRPEDIHIEDIAHALACINRFGGHLREPYPVAQHCLVVALFMHEAGDPPLWGLMHEVAEALSELGDVCGPTKREPSISAVVKPLEHGIERAAEIRFGLPVGFASDPKTKRADLLAYAWEDRDLRGGTDDDDWVAPLRAQLPAEVLVPMSWREAEREFLRMFRELTSAGGGA